MPATAAVLVEVVQGEGGIVPLPGDYLRGVEALCRKHDILFICDEVQAGLCRTGTFWAFQQHGLTPDAISMAKSLANGLPMGAMLATDEMAKGFEAGSHATTFGGGALASGVAAKCVEIMLRDKLADRAAELGKHVMDRVRAIQDKLPGTVREVRGLGLMIGIELAVDAGQVSISMLQRRLRVGYARAGRLVDEMTLRGITAEAEGPTKPRTVLISREEWRRMQENQE